jgi:hypothetical protein
VLAGILFGPWVKVLAGGMRYCTLYVSAPSEALHPTLALLAPVKAKVEITKFPMGVAFALGSTIVLPNESTYERVNP